MPDIRILSDKLINIIAAGEVVQYPYHILKELLENSLDALQSLPTHDLRTRKINIEIRQAGKSLISVADNGIGMSKNNLRRALLRHATSKLDENNLDDIRTLGFRGEGLAAIAAVTKVSITSRQSSDLNAWRISSDNTPSDPMPIEAVQPAARSEGTTVEARDLFHNQTNRLRFLRSDATEASHCISLIQSLAITYPNIAWHVTHNEKEIIHYPSITGCLMPAFENSVDIESLSLLQPRLDQIMGEDFTANSIPIYYACSTFSIHGYISAPTFSRNKSSKLYAFVNQRLIKDNSLYSAVRIGYGTTIPKEQHPTVVLFISVLPNLVNVNIHPNKTEVKFSEEKDIRAVLIHIIRTAIAKARPGHYLANKAIEHFQELPSFNREQSKTEATVIAEDNWRDNLPYFANDINRRNDNINEPDNQSFQAVQDKATSAIEKIDSAFTQDYSRDADVNNYIGLAKGDHRFRTTSLFSEDDTLGQPLCQLGLRYVIATTHDSLVIVDQHAAHERLVLQPLFEHFQRNPIISQKILIPQTYDLGASKNQLILGIKEEMRRIGYGLHADDEQRIVITEIPVIFGGLEHHRLLESIADHIDDYRFINDETIERILGEVACHSSIRSGRKMNTVEMNKLLRDIETTDFSGQCNHGRPTYIKIALSYIDKLFERC